MSDIGNSQMINEALFQSVDEIRSMVSELLFLQKGGVLKPSESSSGHVVSVGCHDNEDPQEISDKQEDLPADILPVSRSVEDLLRALSSTHDSLCDVTLSFDDDISTDGGAIVSYSDALPREEILSDAEYRSSLPEAVDWNNSDDPPAKFKLYVTNPQIYCLPTERVKSRSREDMETYEENTEELDSGLRKEGINNFEKAKLVEETGHTSSFLDPQIGDRDIFLSANASLSSSLLSLDGECTPTCGETEYLIGNNSLDGKILIHEPHPSLLYNPSNGCDSPGKIRSPEKRAYQDLHGRSYTDESGHSPAGFSDDGSSSELEDYTDCLSSTSLVQDRKERALQINWMIMKIQNLLQSDSVINKNVRNIRETLGRLSTDPVSCWFDQLLNFTFVVQLVVGLIS